MASRGLLAVLIFLYKACGKVELPSWSATPGPFSCLVFRLPGMDEWVRKGGCVPTVAGWEC